ncbi:hypothetical protein M0R45_018132 [Rubus argutus]|uniref:Uncharacterized protein n=1 Tax=Rubus argutus TaxID=59490 RepID=A0AAW1X4A2_RUBAR
MEGKREEGIIRKGPWKAEEDEVLLNHVNKCGPRDWSSIRSKGLLQRTGKSCRLRWVNKLRPNLKNGCKFSLEEERVVIELQAQFGNKWAKIATYLPGRTDNDVKNFWSSRQKRLARILQSADINSDHTLQTITQNKREVPDYHDEVPTLEIPKLSCSSEGESSSEAASPCIGSSNAIKMVPLPDLELLGFEANPIHHELALTEKNDVWIESQPLISFLENPQPAQTDLEFSSNTQQLLRDPYFDMFGPLDAEHGNGEPPLLEPVGSCGNVEGEKIDNLIIPNCVFDDFPADMFDHIEPLPNPSDD